MQSEWISTINVVLDRILDNQPIDSELEAIWAGLHPEEKEAVGEVLHRLKRLQDIHNELQSFSISLSRGELGVEPPPRTNYLAGGLKQLQTHLRHLTWQTQIISDGNFSQRVEFMGEFSDAFNRMIDQIRDRETNMLTQRETMLRVFDQIEPVFIVAEEDPHHVRYANKMAKLRFHLNDDSQKKRDLLGGFRSQCLPQTSEQILDTDSGRWYRVSCEPFFWNQESDSRLYHCADVTAHVKRENDLEQEAYTDKLTGLNNRYAFERSFDKLWGMCRQNQSPLSLVMFDIDFFKAVNDTYGHLQGDKCLVAFSETLRKCIGRFNDVIARFGGEEFVVLLPFTNEESAAKVADSVRKETALLEIPMERAEQGQGQEIIRFTVSGGVACCVPAFGLVQDELLANADEALYAAKQSGRDRVCVAGGKEGCL
ncbi:MAG: GGDEF domain-containing protein [Clostridiales bacterium]|nr:GGDEF domain-containing protein [Clostridiales bacterium]